MVVNELLLNNLSVIQWFTALLFILVEEWWLFVACCSWKRWSNHQIMAWNWMIITIVILTILLNYDCHPMPVWLYDDDQKVLFMHHAMQPKISRFNSVDNVCVCIYCTMCSNIASTLKRRTINQMLAADNDDYDHQGSRQFAATVSIDSHQQLPADQSLMLP